MSVHNFSIVISRNLLFRMRIYNLGNLSFIHQVVIMWPINNMKYIFRLYLLLWFVFGQNCYSQAIYDKLFNTSKVKQGYSIPENKGENVPTTEDILIESGQCYFHSKAGLITSFTHFIALIYFIKHITVSKINWKCLTAVVCPCKILCPSGL